MEKIIIDIRDESELLDSKMHTFDENTYILNIPTRNIKFNIEGINKLSKKYKIYLVCRSSNRSDKVKNKYFKDNENVISVSGGIKKENELFNIISEKGGMGFQQIMQIIFSIILLVIAILLFMKINRNIILLIISIMIILILLQAFTKSCVLSKIIPF